MSLRIKKKEPMHTVTFHIDKITDEKITKDAIKQDVSRARIFRTILRKYYSEVV